MFGQNTSNATIDVKLGYFCIMFKDIRSLSSSDLKIAVTELGEKPFRAKQLEEWIWTKSAGSFDEMTNLSKPFRESLKERFFIKRIELSEKQKSNTNNK